MYVLRAVRSVTTVRKLVRMKRIVFIILVIFSLKCDSAKILAVYPTPSISHQKFYGVLTEELLRRGHEVVVITTDSVFPQGQKPINLTEIELHDISHSVWQKRRTTKRGKENFLKHMTQAFESANEIVEAQMKTPDVRRTLLEDKFDLLIIQERVRPLIVFSHFHKVPVVKVSSSGMLFAKYWNLGVPTHVLHYPVQISHRTFNLTFWEKLSEIYNYILAGHMHDSLLPAENAMLKRLFGEDIPSIEELNEDVDMLFENIHQLWEGIRPIPPAVVHMGGIYETHEKPVNELPKDLASFLDSSVHGVIYMSFGTNTPTRMLPPERIQMFIHVFSQLPYDVLWKWDEDELPGRTKNIRIGKWFPQSDLLRHEKIKLFITQGGTQSIDECLNAGVPMLGVPLASDQFFNTENFIRFHIGIKLDLDTIDEHQMKNAIETIIEDKSYRAGIVRLRSLLLDQRPQPLQRVMWWIEYLLKHGGAKHLRCSSAHLSLAQYFELELLALVFATMALTVFCVYIAFKYAWRCLLNSRASGIFRKALLK